MPGIGISISPMFRRGGGASYGAYTTAFYNVVVAGGGSLTAAELGYLTTFETALGADMAEFDRLWIHGLSDPIAAKTSFVNPSSTKITAVNSPTFTANQGYQGNGSTSYLDSNFAQNSATKYTKDLSSYGVYVLNTQTADISILMGVVNTNITQFSPNFSAVNQSLFSTNATGNSLGTFQLHQGFHFIRRTASNLTTYYRNGILISTDATSSANLNSDNWFILARSVLGTPSLFSPNKISLSFIGSGAINQSNFYNASQTLGTSIGWAV